MKKIVLLMVGLFGFVLANTENIKKEPLDSQTIANLVEIFNKETPKKISDTATLLNVGYNKKQNILSWDFLVTESFSSYSKKDLEKREQIIKKTLIENICNDSSVINTFGNNKGLILKFNYNSTDKIFSASIPLSLEKDCKNAK